MPKVTVTFNLPDEAHEYKRHLDAYKMYSIIDGFTTLLRTETKYGDGKKVYWEEVKRQWWEILQDENYSPYAD